MKALLKLAAAGVVSLAVVATAAAAPTPMTLEFDHVVLSTPATPDTVLTSPSTPVTMIAQYDSSTGSFTVAPATLVFPSSTFTSPVPGKIRIVLGQPATGQFNAATGQLTMTIDFVADITVTGVGSCTIDPGAHEYSTGNAVVYPGSPFPSTANGLFTGPGAISGGWTSVPAGVGDACGLIGSAVDGPGGFWLSMGLAPPAAKLPAKLSLSAAPALRIVGPGQSVSFTASVRNTGGTAASNVSLCIAAPKALHVHGPKCKSVTALAAGASLTAKFSLKTPKGARGHYRVGFTATGRDLGIIRRTSTVKIKAQRRRRK